MAPLLDNRTILKSRDDLMDFLGKEELVSATPDSTGSQSDADDRNIQDRKMKL